MFYPIESRLICLAGFAGLAFVLGCGSDKGASPVDAAADGAAVAFDGHSLSLEGGDDADAEVPGDAGLGSDAGARDGTAETGVGDGGGSAADLAGDHGGGADDEPDSGWEVDSDPDVAAHGRMDSGSGGSADARPLEDDIVFDGLDDEGVRRILLWPAGTSTAIPFGAGYVGSHPSPRPDGRALLLQSLATEDDPSGLKLVDDFSKPARFFAERSAGNEREPAWSPDGRHVAFIAHASDPSGDVWVAEVAGDHLQDVRNLTPCKICLPGREAETTPTWSPDGTLIAFTSYAGPSPSIWVMNADGSGAHPVTVTDEQAADYFPDWSPDGRFIVFQRNSAGPTRIGIVAVADGSIRFLDLSNRSYNPAWSRDGRKIAIAVRRPDADTDIVIVTVEGAELARLVRPGNDYRPAWMPRTAR